MPADTGNFTPGDIPNSYTNSTWKGMKREKWISSSPRANLPEESKRLLQAHDFRAAMELNLSQDLVFVPY